MTYNGNDVLCTKCSPTAKDGPPNGTLPTTKDKKSSKSKSSNKPKQAVAATIRKSDKSHQEICENLLQIANKFPELLL